MPRAETCRSRRRSPTASRVDERIDHAFVAGEFYNQPPRDGAHAHLPAGDVTSAQVLRLMPLTGGRSDCGGQILAAELPRADAERVIAALMSEPAFPGGPRVSGAVARRAGRRRTVTLALAPFRTPTAQRIVGRELDWQPSRATWRDALLAAIVPT
jgi:hypothetical protein